jgi:DNA-binding transcriptional ArsR family regulator
MGRGSLPIWEPGSRRNTASASKRLPRRRVSVFSFVSAVMRRLPCRRLRLPRSPSLRHTRLVCLTAFRRRAGMGRFPGPISWKTEVWIAEIQNAASISTANDSSAPMPGPHAPEPSARGHEPIGALRPWPPPLGGVAYARVRSPLPPILKRDACISILEDANLIFMTDPVRLARILKVLSVPARVRIVQLLKGRALCVNALTARLDMTQGAVSQHLRIMRDAGFVVDEKRGCFVHYRLNKEAFAEWQEQLGNLLDPDNASGENAMGAETCAVAMKKKLKSRQGGRILC